MKVLLFKELALVSRVQRAGRRLKFHPKVTVIVGKNGTGKSSLVKSLFATLGASPYGVHPRWKNAKVISSLRFAIDGIAYRALRHDDRLALFDAEDSLIISCKYSSSEWSRAIAQLFDFHLLLTTREGDEKQATPPFLFLPFYVDQDRGWNRKFDSFERIQQFPTPLKSLIEFHFGIRPSSYYKAKSRLSDLTRQMSALRVERQSAQDLLDDLDQRVNGSRVLVNLEDYKAELIRLLDRCQSLRNEEELLARRMTQAYRELAELKDQLAIAEGALHESQLDHEYAEALDQETVVCPVCRAEYDNDFAARFSIAAEQDKLYELTVRLKEGVAEAESEYTSSQVGTIELRNQVAGIESLLAQKHENVALLDVIRAEGKREVVSVLRRKISDMSEKVAMLELQAAVASKELKATQDRKRRVEIMTYYSSQVGRLLNQLDVSHVSVKEYERPEVQTKETGSRLPRALLAFYLACVRTIDKYSTCVMCPMVIDSPRQQDLEAANWDLVRECIRVERPDSAQLILATTEDGGTEFGGDVVRFDSDGEVLRPDQFKEIDDELLPLIDASWKYSSAREK